MTLDKLLKIYEENQHIVDQCKERWPEDYKEGREEALDSLFAKNTKEPEGHLQTSLEEISRVLSLLKESKPRYQHTTDSHEKTISFHAGWISFYEEFRSVFEKHHWLKPVDERKHVLAQQVHDLLQQQDISTLEELVEEIVKYLFKVFQK